MIKNILVGTVLVLLVMASAGATEVKVDLASQTVAAGDAFHVNITVEDVANMRADQAVLNFNPGVMYVTDVIEGDFLKTGGNTLDASGWDNTAGTATLSYALTGTWTPVGGGGTLATIEFETYPDAPGGTHDLSLTDVVLIDANDPPEEILTGVTSGTITIPKPIVPVPVLSGIGMIVLIGMLAIVAISVTKRRRE
jgi:hypothetical protein